MEFLDGIPHGRAAPRAEVAPMLFLLQGTGSVEEKASWQEQGTGQEAVSEMHQWVWVVYQGSGILSLNHFHGLGFILLPLLSSSSLQKVNMLSIQGLEKGIINALNSSINSSSVRTAAERAVLRYEEKLGGTRVWHSGYVKQLWTVR